MQYRRWQVVLCAVAFMMMMGIVGRIDRDTQNIMSERDKAEARQQISERLCRK